MFFTRGIAVAAAIFGAMPAQAADPTDPSWPCVQRKVERLSAGVMWPLALPEGAASLSSDQQDLVSALVLRRISVEEAGKMIAEFGAAQDLSEGEWSAIFASFFKRLDQNRTELIRGIERYANSQIELSKEIDGLRQKMDGALAATEPDYDQIDVMEVDLDWKTRIFDDRSRSLTYVCESPVLLEKRLYAIAQLLLAQTQN